MDQTGHPAALLDCCERVEACLDSREKLDPDDKAKPAQELREVDFQLLKDGQTIARIKRIFEVHLQKDCILPVRELLKGESDG